jgi:hypothetical protein
VIKDKDGKATVKEPGDDASVKSGKSGRKK